MINVAPHMRITGLQVTDEDVARRNQGVADLAALYGKSKNADLILMKAGEIAGALGGDGTPSPGLGTEVETAVRPHAASFVSSEKPLEVGIYSGLAALSVIAPDPTSALAWAVADVLAAGLWSALSFQPALAETKREALRSQVLSAARSRVLRVAELARKRTEVPDFTELSITAESFEKVPGAFKKATATTIEALRRNASLDREELDFLWWAMLGRSRILKIRLDDLDEPVRVVVAGIEAADNLRRLPCDVHRELVLRSVSVDVKLDLAGILTALGDHRAVLASKLSTVGMPQIPSVFPLLSSIVSNNANIDGASDKRTTSDWGARALLEAGLCSIRLTPNSGL